MKSARCLLSWLCAVAVFCSLMNAQQTSSSAQSAVVPRLVNFSGKAMDPQGKSIPGIAGATFAIYKDQYEGTPLWLETQSVTGDSKGNYTVRLGATRADGLPLDLFSSGEARWLGVTINDGSEQPRVLLLSVPYALKAADAETIGGLPPSAFVLAAAPNMANAASGASAPSAAPANANLSPLALGGSGTLDFVPLWTPNGNTLGNSVLFQSGSGSAAKIGINTTKPASTLDVSGAETVRGNLSLPATGTATATSGKNSQPSTLTASTYNSSTKAAVAQNFRWQAEPAGNNTASPSGTLNLLFGSGSGTPSETGLNIFSNGQITFASGQTFPGTGTITGVTTAAGSGLTGGGTSGNVTLGVDSTQVPFLGMSNTFTGNQTVNGSLTASALNGNGVNLTNLNASNLTAGTVPVSVLSGTYNINISGNAATASSVNGSTGAFSGNNSTQIVTVTQSGNGSGLVANAGNAGIVSSGGVEGVYGSGGSYGVYGFGGSYGAYGISGGYGVYGSGGETGVYGTGSSYGVYGYNSSNYSSGALATSVSGNATGVYAYGSVFGVYASGGDTGISASGIYGVIGTGSSAGNGVVGSGANGVVGSGFNYGVYASGNFAASGTKSAVVPLPDDRVVSLYAVESPENWFEDFGGGQLRDGAAEVTLDPTFDLTVNTEVGYRVFLTPQGECEGLYVAKKTATGFQVRELRGGKSNVGFDYRIVAKRKGLESLRMEEVSAEHETAEAIRQQIADRPLHAPRLVLPKVQEPPADREGPRMPGKSDAPPAPVLIVPPAIAGPKPVVPKPPRLPRS